MKKVMLLLVLSMVYIICNPQTVSSSDYEVPIQEEPADKSVAYQLIPKKLKSVDLVLSASVVEEPAEEIYICPLTDEEILLIAWITMGEAEGEPEEGKRLVIDTILNRVDSEIFPNTVTEVIYEPEQFSCVWNGRLNNTAPNDYVCDLVREEVKERLNDEVIFFTANHYGRFGEPLFQVGNHYFCK